MAIQVLIYNRDFVTAIPCVDLEPYNPLKATFLETSPSSRITAEWVSYISLVLVIVSFGGVARISYVV
jgi:hypothetical protein